MAYDEGLAQIIREVLGDTPGIGEKKMFGGLCFTLGGNMMVGIVKESLMARVGEDAALAGLSKPGARPMDFTGKPMNGYLFVDPIGIAEDHELEAWIGLAKAFVLTLQTKDDKADVARNSLRSPRPSKQLASAK